MEICVYDARLVHMALAKTHLFAARRRQRFGISGFERGLNDLYRFRYTELRWKHGPGGSASN